MKVLIGEYELMPGNMGKDCPGNGEYVDKNGNPIEMGCDGCDYLMCCLVKLWEYRCEVCTKSSCPRFQKRLKEKKTQPNK